MAVRVRPITVETYNILILKYLYLKITVQTCMHFWEPSQELQGKKTPSNAREFVDFSNVPDIESPEKFYHVQIRFETEYA